MKRREFIKSIGALALAPLACLLGGKDKYGGHYTHVRTIPSVVCELPPEHETTVFHLKPTISCLCKK